VYIRGRARRGDDGGGGGRYIRGDEAGEGKGEVKNVAVTRRRRSARRERGHPSPVRPLGSSRFPGRANGHSFKNRTGE
jgi:hypothetical protein